MNPETIPQRIRYIVEGYPTTAAQLAKTGKNKETGFQPSTYKDMWDEASRFGAGLATLGVTRGSHVGIIADNRREWLVADLAILGLGAADVPRGSDSTKEEVSYILSHADCTAAIAEDSAQMEKILSGLPAKSALKVLIVFDNSLGSHRKAPSSLQLLNFDEVLERGKVELAKDARAFEKEVALGKASDLATIIYTSGTTGEPKGVMLTHRSFTFQIDRIFPVLGVKHLDRFLSVLPVWHSYERAIEYVVLCCGATIAYSKPIGKIMLEDMKEVKPQWFPSVPRIWESVRSAVLRNVKSQSALRQGMFNVFVAIGSMYADVRDKFLGRWPRFHRHWQLPTAIWTFLPLVLLWPLNKLGQALAFGKIKALLGGEFIAGVSGGGALPGHVDKFFRAVGILVLEGYGLTETGPVLAVRSTKSPVTTTVGNLLADVEFKVIDEESKLKRGPGKKGELWVKSPQVMLGYYKRPDLTEKVLKDGWLNTGDLVMSTVKKEIRIVGRSKDTIVLRGGENIEPEPIEQKLMQSEFIDQIMVVGQDQKYLGALIVPNFDLMEQFAKERRITYIDREELLGNAQILEYVHEVVQHLVNPRTGFKPFERVFKVYLLPRAFQIGVEMTQKLSLKRNVVAELYKKEIAGLFDNRGEEQ